MMKKNISVVLLEDISSLGKAGDIVEVAEGHARNFLFPEGKAALATPEMRQQHAARAQQQAAVDATKLAEVQQKAESLTGTELTLTAQIKEGTEIFGKITAKDIAKELNSQAQLTLKAKDIKLKQAITDIGSHDVEITLSDDVATTIRVTVVAAPGSTPVSDEEA